MPLISAKQVAKTNPTTATPSVKPQVRRLKKGELLFAESENSSSMYILKNGIIRIFKKKGAAQIEIDTIHSGQILGELAFLDGQPRSASGEALTDCELMEISTTLFSQTLSIIPDWLKLLLKTIVTRLRTASTRIKQLESVSTGVDYSSKDGGKRSLSYLYLAPPDVLRILSSVLLVSTHYGEQSEDGISLNIPKLQRYANQIMNVPVAKITTLIDILTQQNILFIADINESSQIKIKDLVFLEQAIAYLNEENLATPNKRHDLSAKDFLIMSLIAKYLPSFSEDATSGMTIVNLEEIRKNQGAHSGKDPFRIEDTATLVKLGYITPPQVKASDSIFAGLKADEFKQCYRLQSLVKAIEVVNEEKSTKK